MTKVNWGQILVTIAIFALVAITGNLWLLILLAVLHMHPYTYGVDLPVISKVTDMLSKQRVRIDGCRKSQDILIELVEKHQQQLDTLIVFASKIQAVESTKEDKKDV